MDLTQVFEELALTTHFDSQLKEILNKLPNHLVNLYEQSAFDKMRVSIAGTTTFSDAISVVR